MANIKSAKKRIRVVDKKTARNARIKGHMKQAEKNYLKALAAGNVDDATKAFVVLEKELMQAASKNTIHKKTASRKVSRMAARLNALKAQKTLSAMKITDRVPSFFIAITGFLKPSDCLRPRRAFPSPRRRCSAPSR